MKVSKLISLLQKFDSNAEVKLNSYYGDNLLFVLARSDDKNVVWFEGASDCDLEGELKARTTPEALKQYKNPDKLFDELIDLGVTVQQVSDYLGDKYADRMIERIKIREALDKIEAKK